MRRLKSAARAEALLSDGATIACCGAPETCWTPDGSPRSARSFSARVAIMVTHPSRTKSLRFNRSSSRLRIHPADWLTGYTFLRARETQTTGEGAGKPRGFQIVDSVPQITSRMVSNRRIAFSCHVAARSKLPTRAELPNQFDPARNRCVATGGGLAAHQVDVQGHLALLPGCIQRCWAQRRVGSGARRNGPTLTLYCHHARFDALCQS